MPGIDKRKERKRQQAFPESTLRELDREKLTPSETYYDVVDRLIKELKAFRKKEATS